LLALALALLVLGEVEVAGRGALVQRGRHALHKGALARGVAVGGAALGEGGAALGERLQVRK
jgi:hypothetical protein